MSNKTKTYLAGDWDHDKIVIDKLRTWNNSKYWGLNFTDVHEAAQSNDSSLNCSIKTSLGNRMDSCKTFVLIVGSDTKKVRAGSCYYCEHYNPNKQACEKNRNLSTKSFIEYECDKAVRDKLKIVVLYNYSFIYKDKCPDSVKDIGSHLNAYSWEGNEKIWNYNNIKNAIMDE